MNKIRLTFLTAFALIFYFVSQAPALDRGWIHWQQLYNQERANAAENISGQERWRSIPLEIKEIEVSATLPDYPYTRVSQFRGFERERCVTCHVGVQGAGASHPPSFGCTVCHGGDGNAVDETTAHTSLIYDPDLGLGRGNPSSMKVAALSCGQSGCHAGHSDPDRNHIKRMQKSMMGTLAGMISGLRFQWGGQTEKHALYGIEAIADDDGDVPLESGAQNKLDTLPYFSERDYKRAWDKGSLQGEPGISRHIGDNLLRNKCFQCHLDSVGPGPTDFRSQGCAACHVPYASDGLYRGDDPTQSKTQPGKPRAHVIEAVPNSRVCVQCHRAYTYEEPAVKTNDNAPNLQEASLPKTARFKVNASAPAGMGSGKADIHFEKGFECIDCHTQFDIMGDGNIYSKQHQAVEVRCETCHGSEQAAPAVASITDPNDRAVRLSRHYKGGPNQPGDAMALTARDRKMTNVKSIDGKIVTFGKRSGRRMIAPQTRNARAAHSIPGHIGKLECSACHAQWTPRCDGCHNAMDQSRPVPADHKAAKFFWGSVESQLSLETPQLIVGPRGKAAPMSPQPERALTLLDEKGAPIPVISGLGNTIGRYLDWRFSNAEGYSGANRVYRTEPHSTRRQVRACADCHLSSRTLGLGEGDIELGSHPSGRNDLIAPLDRSDRIAKRSNYGPDAKATARGERLSGSHQESRPFNQREITTLLRVGNCIACHDTYGDPIYQNMSKSYAFAESIKHQQMRNKILNSADSQP
ncbi:MAG: hypothetical protein G3M78_01330 [Candidatus Nitrohelix vancouverensis]|uniref:Cytochrome c-552/4 domain-containing protein n=1 Tax=Candidatus Nitrohelix vancouverensis TaxID=2705534 RepID=A0A7T0C0G8_9BACT|nr:MAG: hypothetical protein G3M78_01330 [Candidatus Nitrohelix vancouverensis]